MPPRRGLTPKACLPSRDSWFHSGPFMPVPVAQRSKLTGVCPPARGAVVADLCRVHPAPVWLVIAENLKAAEHLAEDVAFFHGASGDKRPLQTLVFPESMQDNRDMREAFAA